jgi:FlaG/FlaF family flagellin (archaellin)
MTPTVKRTDNGGTTSQPAERRSPDERAVSALVGGLLLLLLTVVLAGILVVLLPSLQPPVPAEERAVGVEIDAGDDQVRLRHLAGEPLAADRTRIVWTVGDQQYISSAGSGGTLEPGEAAVFTFDGATAVGGSWTGYDSPGTSNIEPEEAVAVTLVDTETEEIVYRTTTTASEASADITARTYDGSLVWVDDPTAGATDVQLRVNFTIETGSATVGNSLNSLEMKFTSGPPDVFSGTTSADVQTVGVDTDGDGAIDVDLSSDVDGWTVSDGGSRLTVGFTGAAYTNPQAGESVILVVGGVDTPDDPANGDVKLQTSGDGNWQYGSLSIE